MARWLAPAADDAPVSIEFPRDDGPHDSKIEWWYFTGHFESGAGEAYGFEYVIFRARSGAFEGYVSHFAITDVARDRFRYDQRILGGAGVSGDGDLLDLDLDGWTMRGGGGSFSLRASIDDYAIDIELRSTKPAALHDGDGYIDYGNGTGSYYYSWTRLDLSGVLETDRGAEPVTGMAWMDHQWGYFDTYQAGGWDWFSVQLENGVDVMLYLLRLPDGSPLRVDGSIVSADGELATLRAEDFEVRPIGEWTSAATGITYPSGWEIDIPRAALAMTITPVLPNQELDTRPTTGVIYWEGLSLVEAVENGEPLRGRGYVELTGYSPYEPPELSDLTATPRS